MTKPSVGRIVHVMIGGIVYPAVITHVWSDTCVNLNVFNDGSYKIDGLNEASVMKTSVMYDESRTSHSWHWPERS